jgi:hypothetical protein
VAITTSVERGLTITVHGLHSRRAVEEADRALRYGARAVNIEPDGDDTYRMVILLDSSGEGLRVLVQAAVLLVQAGADPKDLQPLHQWVPRH